MTTTGESKTAAASDVKDEIKSQGHEVASTAAKEAGALAEEVRAHAGTVVTNARDQLEEQADAQTRKIGEGIQNARRQLESMTERRRTRSGHELGAAACGFAGFDRRHHRGWRTARARRRRAILRATSAGAVPDGRRGCGLPRGPPATSRRQQSTPSTTPAACRVERPVRAGVVQVPTELARRERQRAPAPFPSHRWASSSPSSAATSGSWSGTRCSSRRRR